VSLPLTQVIVVFFAAVVVAVGIVFWAWALAKDLRVKGHAA
jgi:hypothetical protein